MNSLLRDLIFVLEKHLSDDVKEEPVKDSDVVEPSTESENEIFIEWFGKTFKRSRVENPLKIKDLFKEFKLYCRDNGITLLISKKITYNVFVKLIRQISPVDRMRVDGVDYRSCLFFYEKA